MKEEDEEGGTWVGLTTSEVAWWKQGTSRGGECQQPPESLIDRLDYGRHGGSAALILYVLRGCSHWFLLTVEKHVVGDPRCECESEWRVCMCPLMDW